MVNGTARDGAQLKKQFLSNMPTLEKLIHRVQGASERGNVIGLDGRRIFIRHQHAALNTLVTRCWSNIL